MGSLLALSRVRNKPVKCRSHAAKVAIRRAKRAVRQAYGI